jgi:hypothetical protein
MDETGVHVTEESSHLRVWITGGSGRYFAVPPHATHVLQPLDLVIFGEIKRRFHEANRQRREAHLQEVRLSMSDFFLTYFDVRKLAITPSLCAAAYRHAGILPQNPEIPRSKLASQPQSSSSLPQPRIQRPNELPSLVEDIQKAIERNRSARSRFSVVTCVLESAHF